MVTQLVYLTNFKQLCKEVIYENQYTLEACFGTCDVDILYSILFHNPKYKEYSDAVLKIAKSRM